MTDMTDKVVEYFNNGYNCAQAICAAYAPQLGIDTETALKASLGLGSGIVKTREICGAIAAMTMMLGFKYGAEDRVTSYAMGQKMIARFKELNGGRIVCRDLLGLDDQGLPLLDEEVNTTEFERRPCIEYAKMASQIIAEYL